MDLGLDVGFIKILSLHFFRILFTLKGSLVQCLTTHKEGSLHLSVFILKCLKCYIKQNMSSCIITH